MPTLTGQYWNTCGNFVGELNEGTGKKVFMEFGFGNYMWRPAWYRWIRQFRDAVREEWVKDNVAPGETLLVIDILDGKVASVRPFYKTKADKKPAEAFGAAGQEMRAMCAGPYDAKEVNGYRALRQVVEGNAVPFPESTPGGISLYVWFQNSCMCKTRVERHRPHH